MKHLIITITAFALIINYSCSDEGTKPPDNNGLDTTSHEVTWQTFEFGIYPSILHDVAIINQNEIWAVGEIHTEETDKFDSLGNWVKPFNIAQWDGEKWDLKHIKTPFRNGNIIPNLIGVFAYNENDIWLSSGTPKYWDGKKWTNFDLWEIGVLDNNDGGVLNIWGTSSNDIYFVGRKGTIVHYDGQNWRKSNSPTNLILSNVIGSPDGSVVWASGFEGDKGSVLLRNTGKGFEKVVEVTRPDIPHPPDQITHPFQGIWTDNADSVYIASIGRVYHAPVNTNGNARENIWFDYDNDPGFPNETKAISGTKPNDIFIVGFRNFVRHYNGRTWYKYDELMTNSGYWYAIDVKENIIVTVGETPDGKAFVAVGKR